MRELIRECRFSPYRGKGPHYTLRLYDTGRSRDGKYQLAYELRQHKTKTTVLFTGNDFYCSPLHAIDSDETVRSLMSFLTLRIGDTDLEYFDSYTDVQKEFRDSHAESLSAEVANRFGF